MKQYSKYFYSDEKTYSGNIEKVDTSYLDTVGEKLSSINLETELENLKTIEKTISSAFVNDNSTKFTEVFTGFVSNCTTFVGELSKYGILLKTISSSYTEIQEQSKKFISSE